MGFRGPGTEKCASKNDLQATFSCDNPLPWNRQRLHHPVNGHRREEVNQEVCLEIVPAWPSCQQDDSRIDDQNLKLRFFIQEQGIEKQEWTEWMKVKILK